jgi:hypothetical protein
MEKRKRRSFDDDMQVIDLSEIEDYLTQDLNVEMSPYPKKADSKRGKHRKTPTKNELNVESCVCITAIVLYL